MKEEKGREWNKIEKRKRGEGEKGRKKKEEKGRKAEILKITNEHIKRERDREDREKVVISS